jgi:hypothetical protein
VAQDKDRTSTGSRGKIEQKADKGGETSQGEKETQ